MSIVVLIRPLSSAEDAFQAKQQQELQEAKASADREEAHISGECTAEKQRSWILKGP